MVPYYRPFIEIIYQLQHFFFGTSNPFLYHLFNILLHILNSLLIYILIKSFRRDHYFALSSAILFLVHPVQTEAVTAIAGVTNLLYTFFCLLSFIFYIKTKEAHSKPKNLLIYVVSLFSFLLALLNKEPAIILPLLILWYEIFIVKDFRNLLTVRCIRLFGFFLIGFEYLMFRKLMLGSMATPFLENTGEFWLRVLAIAQSLTGYLKIIFLPVNLHYFRCVNILEPFVASFLSLMIIIILFILIVFRLPKNERGFLIFGLGWFLIALLPTLNILPLIIEYSYIYNSEHFLYFPLLGMIVFSLKAGEYSLRAIFKEKAKKFSSVFLTIIIFVLAISAIKQNIYWTNDITLFNRTLTFEPQLGRVHIVLARSYYLKNNMDKAMGHYFEGLRIMQGYVDKMGGSHTKDFYLGFIKEIHFDLAHCYETKSDFDNAIREYTQALLIDSKDTIIYNNLAVAYLQLNKTNEAIEHFKKAIEFDPKNIMAMSNLAICYIRKGDLDEAELFFKKILNIDPNFSSARYNLERLLKSRGVQ